MEDETLTIILIISGIISLITLIVFFVMAYKIGRINDTLEFFKVIALKDPENWHHLTCTKCKKNFKLPLGATGTTYCPHCGEINNVSGAKHEAEMTVLPPVH